MNTLTHKGYSGSVEYSSEDKCLYGQVLGMGKKIMITYEGETVAELETDFKNSINHYIEGCEKRGETPQKPHSGSFNVRLNPDTHAQIAQIAQSKGISLNAFIKETLRKAVM